ncbi:RNA polymerase sigma-24 subunit ECF subfamily [Patulibacter medicamentivorans]|uniref:RNA polymerase sigma-24 subunit ECF subfamily n=1 Tax=Patulibacter medicamentivorans TaxID=1097667 RepID=H0E4Z9_9ACTN|nr:sigma-70 family RNA polymerase sigma factor [Patulibacter medicamentivorans]EHN11250.1 RNA polymerase sigma-24 subunit ECF subfamily [Patulibacter medicamentivorans]
MPVPATRDDSSIAPVDPARPRRSRLPPFDAVVELHGRALLRFCIARLGPDRGEDAFQETLLAALRRYPQLRDPDAVLGWLFAIAHRKVIDGARSAARGPTPSDRIDEQAGAWLDPEPTGSVWSRVAQLPPKQREAIALRFLADLPHRDVGAAMGTSTEAARRNVHEGLRRLRADGDRA